MAHTAPSVSSQTPSSQPYPGDTASLDATPLKEYSRNAILETLNGIQGSKTLVLERDLAGALGLVVDIGSLKNQAVEKLFWLEEGPLQATSRNIVYLCQPKRNNIRIIADQIKSAQSSSASPTQHIYHFLPTPRLTALGTQILTDFGIIGDLHIQAIGIGAEWIVLEDDLLSLEKDDSVAREIGLDGNDTAVFDSATALMTLQRAYGSFPTVLGKGDGAKRLADLLHRQRTSNPERYSALQPSQTMDGLVVIDRNVDWITPCMTMLTYEGMLAESIGIRNSHIEVDPALLTNDNNKAGNATTSAAPASGSNLPALVREPATPKKRKHQLSSSTDSLFAELRDSNFATVGVKLARTARRVQAEMDTKSLGGKSVGEMKQFVGRLGGLQNEQRNLKLHTGLTEFLMPITQSDDFNKVLEIQQNIITGYDINNQMASIEDLLAQQTQSPYTVLRLIVLLSLCIGGLRQKVLDGFKREFLQTYGYQYLSMFVNLEAAGLLVKSPAPSGNNFAYWRKQLRLWVEEIDEKDPNDIAYVHSGYAPLSVRIVQCVTMKPNVMSIAASRKEASQGGNEPGAREREDRPQIKAHPLAGWRGFEEVMQTLPGSTVDDSRFTGSSNASGQDAEPNKGKTTVVFFLGGCTYAEISALRWMSGQTRGRRYLIATTGIITGTTLFKQFGLDTPPERKAATATL